MSRRRERRAPRTAAAERAYPDEALAERISQRFGNDWIDNHAQALVWAALLVEIPHALIEHEAHAWGLTERIAALEQHDPRSPELHRLRAMRARPPVHCELKAASGTDCILAIVGGTWPNEMRTVEFAMCRRGQVRIRCTNTPWELPAIVQGRPRSLAAAHELAAHLARGAISAVCDSGTPG